MIAFFSKNTLFLFAIGYFYAMINKKGVWLYGIHGILVW